MNQLSELLSQPLLQRRGGCSIWSREESGSRYFRGKPICFGKADSQRYEVVFDLLWRELFANFVERFNGLSRTILLGKTCLLKPRGNFKHDAPRTLSRTNGSSIAARFSRGDRSTCAYSGPPTYSTKFPSSSLRAVRTSSSSSTESNNNPLENEGLKRNQARTKGKLELRTIKERNQFITCSLWTESKGNCRKPMNRI